MLDRDLAADVLRAARVRGGAFAELYVEERAGLSVLHYDRDFDLIASVTGQDVEWVVPAGSVP